MRNNTIRPFTVIICLYRSRSSLSRFGANSNLVNSHIRYVFSRGKEGVNTKWYSMKTESRYFISFL